MYREIHEKMLKIFVIIRLEVLIVCYHIIVRSGYPSSIKYVEKILKNLIEIRFEVLSVCEPFHYKIYRPQFCKM